MKKTIVVFAYSRPQLLKNCFDSIISSFNFRFWSLVVVHQEGDLKVKEVIDLFSIHIDTLINIKKKYDVPLANLNYSRITGTRFAFDTLDSDYVLGVEEDTIIAKDSLTFIEFAISKYVKSKSFRGVNLGSLEQIDSCSNLSYSLIRFGLHGQAGVLTKNSWNYIEKKGLFRLDPNEGWDSKIEFYLKSGFMVTPNLSRDLDSGWGGTHAPDDSMHPHYVAMRKSFVGNNCMNDLKYVRSDIKHSWRTDSVIYRRRDSVIYFLRRSWINNVFKLSNFWLIRRFLVGKLN